MVHRFRAPSNGRPNGQGSLAWYSFDYGTIHVIRSIKSVGASLTELTLLTIELVTNPGTIVSILSSIEIILVRSICFLPIIEEEAKKKNGGREGYQNLGGFAAGPCQILFDDYNECVKEHMAEYIKSLKAKKSS